MLPKSSKHYIKPTADELDCDPILVDDVVSFFYADLRRNLTEMTSPNIQVDNLGSFKAKKSELPKLLVKYEKHLKVLKPETFNQMSTKKKIEIKFERVLNLKNMIDKEAFRKREFRRAKNERS